jgi:hypothetical protein
MPGLGFLAATIGFALFWISLSYTGLVQKQNILAFSWSFCVQLIQLSWDSFF